RRGARRWAWTSCPRTRTGSLPLRTRSRWITTMPRMSVWFSRNPTSTCAASPQGTCIRRGSRPSRRSTTACARRGRICLPWLPTGRPRLPRLPTGGRR
ncbi:hypothetical protein T484DRAFT_1990258, partial [Baffinella frigidus]